MLEKLANEINDCLLIDQQSFKRKLEKLRRTPNNSELYKKLLADFSVNISSSKEAVRTRKASIPVPVYPGNLPINDKKTLIAETLTNHQVLILEGETGSGKTTLLTMLGGLRSCQDGSLKILGEELNGASKIQLARLRLNVGFIFQAHNLMMFLNARKNVRLSLELHDKYYDEDMDALSDEMLAKVGLGERLDYYPSKLSGGQRQRVAIARALVSKPKILLGDEPTAALDKESGRAVVNLMQELAKEQQTTIIMVTHDNKILDVADRIIIVDEGKLATAEEEKLFIEKMRSSEHS